MDKVELQRVQRNYGGVFPLVPHVDNPREELVSETGGGNRGGGRETYVVSFPHVMPSVACLVDGMPG